MPKGEGLALAAHHHDVFLSQLAAADDIGTQMTLLRAGLMAVQMALPGLLALQLAAGCHSESLFGSFVGLHLWHGKSPVI